MNQNENDYKKTLLFKIGVIIIIVLIFSLWLANLQNVFKTESSANNDSLRKIQESLNQSIKETENQLNKKASSTENEFVKNLVDKASSTATSSVSTTTAVLEIKKELTDIIKSDKATTTILKSDCPPYIDCMPTIGESKPCVVPVGCEKITQIAY